MAKSSHVDSNAIKKSIGFGLLGLAILLAVYFAVLTLVSGWAFTISQFSQFWYFVVVLALGFGTQIGLYTYLRSLVRGTEGSGKIVAVSGGTSTAAMVSCCAHYLANILPVLGATGVLAIVAQYQIQLFWVGLLFNLGGVIYVGRKVMLANREMAHMGQHA